MKILVHREGMLSALQLVGGAISTRDVKPILDKHCSGCHAESDLVRAAVKPFEARRSPIVTQTHALLSDSERLQLALWVDLGASGRP